MRLETLTLKEDNADLQQTLLDFMTASGFITVASTDLTGAVTCALDKAPINDVLDKVASLVSAKWQPVYLLCVPRVLSDTEVEARQEQRFQGRWAQYWAKPPEERAKDLQQQIDRINRMAEAAKQPGQNGQQNGAARGLQRMGPRMLSRMNKYSAALPTAQRDEIKPMMQALARAVAGN